MTTIVIPGHGKDPYKLKDYVRFALQVAEEVEAETIILSGGDTGNKFSGSWETRTEAETMKDIAEIMILTGGPPVNIVLEERAFSTFTNVLYSMWLIDDENEEIIFVCNEAHRRKVEAATIRVFGLKVVRQRISFRPFPLTTGKIENLKILAITGPEVIGYFFPPWGVCVSYLQYRWRTGRNDQVGFWKGFWQFRQRFQTGELI